MVLAIQVEFLTGRFVAAAHYDRSEPEWPPHPARLFSALVAAWADSDLPDPGERAALVWLEGQPTPAIAASQHSSRSVVEHYVPDNDPHLIEVEAYRKRYVKLGDDLRLRDEAKAQSGTDPDSRASARALARLAKTRDVTAMVSAGRSSAAALELLPERRGRQPRTFPSVTPFDPVVTYLWRSQPPVEVRDRIDGLLARVPRLGHSSSLVCCRLTSGEPAPTLLPDPSGSLVLRGVAVGQLDALEEAFARHGGTAIRRLPFRPVRYAQPAPPSSVRLPNRSVLAGDWQVFEFAPADRRFPLTRVVEVARTLRDALMSHADELPEGLTGHLPDGRPSQAPHLSFVPLPFVGGRHADGRLVGAAVILPVGADEATRLAVLRAIGNWEETAATLSLLMGRSGRIDMIRVVGPSGLASLRRAAWEGPARTWVSVTPIALPSHPGSLTRGLPASKARAWGLAEEVIAAACRHVGLPAPASVAATFQPLVAGSRPASSFPAFRQRGRDGGGVARLLVHATVEFSEPVAGPLALGSGRYLGLGLMRPVDADG